MTVVVKNAAYPSTIAPDCSTRPSPLLIWAVILGNTLEWYDFIVYGFLASILAKHFFPPGDELAALLGSYSAFALSFIVRPFGGVLIGLYADRVGRGSALVFIMGAMTLAMLIMAFMPTYASIGVWATVLLVVARLLQALSAGGEFASAAAFLIEAAPASRRGLYSSLYSAGPPAAAILSALVGLLITQGISAETRDLWGWRLPFFFGLLIAPIALYIRWKLSEDYRFEVKKAPRGGLLLLLGTRFGRIAVAITLAAVTNAAAYVFLVYAPTYVVTTLKLPSYISFVGLIVSGVTSTVAAPAMGALADRLGRFAFMAAALVILVVFTVPLYAWLGVAPSLERFLAFIIAVSIMSAMFNSVFAQQMAELFEPGLRATAMAFSYNMSAMVFGAFSLVFVTWLTAKTGSALVPGYYVAGVALLCLATNLIFRKLRHRLAE